MNKRLAFTGNQAASYAMKQIGPDVVAAYPITPQTEIVMGYSKYVADGLVKTAMIPVESEHSAMSACVGASASGARTMTATGSNGLALMWEILYIAASTRLPIVMPVVNRALSAPINIHCDHSDSMGARDTGWIQIYCENAQEVYEMLILATRIAEHQDILLPVMVCQDGFITSHAVEMLEAFEDERVREFVGEYAPHQTLLDVIKPVTYGPLDLMDYYFEHKRQQVDAIENAHLHIPELFGSFEKFFGKRYNWVELYRMEDADIVVVVLSSTAGTARVAVDELREEGMKVGLLKPRFMRPFPSESIREALSDVRAVAVLDRSETFSNQGGPIYNQIRSILYESEHRPELANYIYGLGGREINPAMISKVYKDMNKVLESEKVERPITYLGVRN
jgi:pyruvate ferredoxin oxidoreductase alpha subunit